jgi:phosphatidate cytidylyltransferase
MLASRLIVIIVLLPIGLAAIAIGGIAYLLLVALILVLAGVEFGKLFVAGGDHPAGLLIPAGVLAFVLGRAYDGFESAPLILSLFIMAAMAYHLLAYERGYDRSGTDFAITTAGALYIGWLGSYLISLRDLPEGKWWVLLVLPTVWFADSGAFIIGRWLGRRQFSPRLSPKKTWEGYLGGVLCATLGGALLAALWALGAGSQTALTPWRGALMGFLLAVISPLGDLGESMLKRQVGIKDSSSLLFGHGGVFDRIDSWLWGAVIGYYIILGFFL